MVDTMSWSPSVSTNLSSGNLSRKRAAPDEPSSYVLDGDESLLAALWQQLSLKRPCQDAGVSYSTPTYGKRTRDATAVDELVALCRDVHLGKRFHAAESSARASQSPVSVSVEVPSEILDLETPSSSSESQETCMRVTVRVRLPETPALPATPSAFCHAPLPSSLERSLVVYIPRNDELLRTLRRALLSGQRAYMPLALPAGPQSAWGNEAHFSSSTGGRALFSTSSACLSRPAPCDWNFHVVPSDSAMDMDVDAACAPDQLDMVD